MERVKSGYLCYGIVVVAANVSLMKFFTFTRDPIRKRVCYYTIAASFMVQYVQEVVTLQKKY